MCCSMVRQGTNTILRLRISITNNNKNVFHVFSCRLIECNSDNLLFKFYCIRRLLEDIEGDDVEEENSKHF